MVGLELQYVDMRQLMTLQSKHVEHGVVDLQNVSAVIMQDNGVINRVDQFAQTGMRVPQLFDSFLQFRVKTLACGMLAKTNNGIAPGFPVGLCFIGHRASRKIAAKSS